MKKRLDFEYSSSFGFFRALAMCLAFMLIGFLLCCMGSGCLSIRDVAPVVVSSLFDLSTNNSEAVESSVDAVPFDSLVWDSGGFTPASSTVIKGNISSVSFNGKTINYSASVDDDFGNEGEVPNATICAVFFLNSDGVWRGGKFDWIGDIGRPRPAGHIASYSGWSHSYPAPNWEEFAFVLIRGDNRKYRTNVSKGKVE